MTKNSIWLLVADAGRARVFEIDAQARALVRTPVWEMETEIAPSRDIGSDRPGRAFDSAGQGRHAEEPRTDPHRYEKLQTAHHIAHFLDDQRKKEAFGQLIVVAPPQMLGDLREEMSHELKKLIGAELAKDLSMLPRHQLEQHLDEFMGV